VTACIRGCRVPNPDGGRPQPAPVIWPDRRLCAHCADRLWAMLGRVCDDYRELSTEILENGPSERTTTGAPGASPALIRLDVAALLDPRTTLDPAAPGLLHPPAVLVSWARNLAELNAWRIDVYGMGYAVELLRDNWPALTAAPFLADFYDEMQAISRALDIALGRPRATYLGPCISTWLPAEPPWVADWIADADGNLPPIEGPLDHCLAPVYRLADGLIHCRTCGRDYGPREVLALSLNTATEETP
jgi:hypothetical protein